MLITKESRGHKILMRCYADACNFINDRERLRFALTSTLKSIGVGDQQIKKIIAEVRANNFETLNKTLKLSKLVNIKSADAQGELEWISKN